MKNIRNYSAEKYRTSSYHAVAPDIYQCADGFVTSLCFEQEPELGEGTSSAELSQYPLEDVLDRYYVSVSDFYDELNSPDSRDCRLEFCGDSIEDIRQLRTIIGKHVYNKEEGSVIQLVVSNESREIHDNHSRGTGQCVHGR